MQIFEVLRKVGSTHSFSAGLIIGGKDVESEKAHIVGMNILVCTPGRLLQHMDETPGFDCCALKVLGEIPRARQHGHSHLLEQVACLDWHLTAEFIIQNRANRF